MMRMSDSWQENSLEPEIRLRAGMAVVQEDKILLVPHYHPDAGVVQWVIPGGRVRFGEGLREAALREFQEETGCQAQITGLLDVSEVILPEKSWHSVTITWSGAITGGQVKAEPGHRYGEKTPAWFSADELRGLAYHPPQTVEKALAAAAPRAKTPGAKTPEKG